MMLIKYGELDVTNRLLEYKMSVAFSKGYLIGNIPTIQIDLKFDNYDDILTNLDISRYWIIQENENSTIRYFKVYDQPEKYTKTLSLKLYDNNYSLDIAYDTKLSYPVTINDQLDEIETLTGLTISRTNIPQYISSKQVAWYDNTISIRNYLGWIGELFGANGFASGIGGFEYIQVTDSVFETTDTLTDFEKNEVYEVTRVYIDNGIDSMEKGDETGNTMFLDSNNLYIDSQDIIDRLYDQFNGLSFCSASNIKMIAIDNLLPGKLINYNNEFNFMVVDLTNTFKGGEFLLADVDGTVTTKNEERVIKKITNTTRIRKLQVIQDQEKNRLDIIAQEQEDLNSKVGQLTVSNEEIKASIKNVENTIEQIENVITSDITSSEGFYLGENVESTRLTAHMYQNGIEIDVDGTEYLYEWYCCHDNNTEFESLGSGKHITLKKHFLEKAGIKFTAIEITGDESYYLLDENGNILTDENNNRFVYESVTVYFTDEAENRLIDENDNYLTI